MRKAVTLTLLLLGASTLYGQEPFPTFCSSEGIPILPPVDFPALTVSQHSFASGRYAAGSMTVRNRTNKPVRQLSLLVEYLDSNGKGLLVLAYQATKEDVLQDPDFTDHSVRAQYVDELEKEIEPGQSFRIMAQNATTITECPKAARLTLVRLTFSDSTTYEWESLPWRTEAALRDSPPHFRVESLLPGPSSDLLFMVIVDSEGRVSAVEPIGPGTSRHESAVAENLRQWSFFPAMDSGRPVSTELVVLLHFHGDSTGNAGAALGNMADLPRKFALVELLPQHPKSGLWRALFGGFPASRTWIKRGKKD